MKKLKIAFFFILFSCVFNFFNPSLKAEDPYVVSDVAVDARASSALEARTQALSAGHLKAFHLLLERLLKEEKRKVFESVTTEDIEPLVQDLEIAHERLSSVRYMATLSFRFNEKAVRNFLSQKAPGEVPLVVATPKNLATLVIPVLLEKGQTLLWEDTNPWLEVWNQAHENSELKLQIPLGDLKDVSTLSAQEALGGDFPKIKALMDHYGAGTAFVVILRQVTSPAPYSLEIIQYDPKGAVAQEEHPLSEETDPNPSEALLQASLKKSLEIFKTLHQSLVESAEVHLLKVELPFANYKEWRQIRESLTQLPFLQKIEITSLSRQKAFITLTYQGSQKKLEEKLTSNSFRLENEKGNPSRLVPTLEKNLKRLPTTASSELPRSSS